MVTLPLDLLNLLLAGVLPVLTALITARFASSSVKSLVLLALTILAIALQGVFDNGGLLHVRTFLVTTALQFFMAVGGHYGLLKPTGISGTDGVVATSVPAGIGGSAYDDDNEL